MIFTLDEAAQVQCIKKKAIFNAIEDIVNGIIRSDGRGYSVSVPNRSVRANNCEGKECMSWRWHDKERTKGYCGEGGPPLFY